MCWGIPYNTRRINLIVGYTGILPRHQRPTTPGAVMEFDSFSMSDLHHRISSPTCEDLGIPRDLGGEYSRGSLDTGSPIGRLLRSPGSDTSSFEGGVFGIENIKFREMDNPNNPFSPFCQIPLPNPYTPYECGFEPAFIRKRNERERERVRCVNDGYVKLRNHLPSQESKEKRISKVETLRGAIKYIRHLQTLLTELDRTSAHAKSTPNHSKENTESSSGEKTKTSTKVTKSRGNMNLTSGAKVKRISQGNEM